MKNKQIEQTDWTESHRSCVEANLYDYKSGRISIPECVDRIINHYKTHEEQNSKPEKVEEKQQTSYYPKSIPWENTPYKPNTKQTKLDEILEDLWCRALAVGKDYEKLIEYKQIKERSIEIEKQAIADLFEEKMGEVINSYWSLLRLTDLVPNDPTLEDALKEVETGLLEKLRQVKEEL